MLVWTTCVFALQSRANSGQRLLSLQAEKCAACDSHGLSSLKYSTPGRLPGMLNPSRFLLHAHRDSVWLSWEAGGRSRAGCRCFKVKPPQSKVVPGIPNPNRRWRWWCWISRYTVTRSGQLRTLWRTQSLKVLPLKLRVGQYICVLRLLPGISSLLISTLLVHSPAFSPPNPSLKSPQWGAADAEIKVPSVENTELRRSPFQAWSRSVYSHTCYAYCQGFLPCLFLPFQSPAFFPKPLPIFSCVGLQNKIGHPAGCRFPCWVSAAYK